MRKVKRSPCYIVNVTLARQHSDLAKRFLSLADSVPSQRGTFKQLATHHWASATTYLQYAQEGV